jgi:hypothetical protein
MNIGGIIVYCCLEYFINDSHGGNLANFLFVLSGELCWDDNRIRYIYFWWWQVTSNPSFSPRLKSGPPCQITPNPDIETTYSESQDRLSTKNPAGQQTNKLTNTIRDIKIYALLAGRHNDPTRLLYSLSIQKSGTRRIEKEFVQNSLLFLRRTQSLRL